MAPTQSRKPAPKKTSRKPKLLTSFRVLDENGVIKWSGFGRTLGLSETDVFFESPDQFPIGQFLKLEFLLDDDVIADASGHVTKIAQGKIMYNVYISLDKPSARTRRLIEKQISG